MIVNDKQIYGAYYDDEFQTWVVRGVVHWQGEMKDGCKEIVEGYGPYVKGAISEYYQLEPDVWCISGLFYADYDDVFASGVIKVLQENGWKWS